MYQRVRCTLKSTIVPPYVTKMQGGKHVRYDDVEEIDPALTLEMFALSTNVENGENLKEAKIEPINMLQEVESIAQRCSDLETQIQNYKREKELADVYAKHEADSIKFNQENGTEK